MGTQSAAEVRFREQVRDLRTGRRLSQAGLAKLLQDRGLEHILPSTVAKIESGDRAVRIDEANVLADIFGGSVDVLLGRAPGIGEDGIDRELRRARHQCTRAQLDAQGWRTSLSETATALRAVLGWQPEGDGRALMEACIDAATALAGVDRVLGSALVEAGGLAR